ncbi:MAG: ribosome maturation factor RimM [Burkholderiaceae bacterium]
MPEQDSPPSALIELGAVRGAYGVKGWVKIVPYDAGAEVLRTTRNWWLLRDGARERLAVTAVRRHAALLLAKWAGCESPEAADAIRGAAIAVPREEFPALAPGRYYWVDLIGARVINRRGVDLGEVRGLRSNGAQDLLEVGTAGSTLLVPMVDAYVDRIDPARRRIEVDWEADW